MSYENTTPAISQSLLNPVEEETMTQKLLEVGQEMEESASLAQKVRVLCWVLTYPPEHKTVCPHVKATWGKRCDKLIFMSTQEDKELGSVYLNVPEGYKRLWAKTYEAVRYLYNNHLHQYDWFLKADTDTYVVMENLRYMLDNYDPARAIFLGLRYDFLVNKGYMAGGAGYVMSREAVRRFGENKEVEKCPYAERRSEDVRISRCMKRLWVMFADTRDYLHKGRFFQFNISDSFADVDKIKHFYERKQGKDCCSDGVISFHKMKVSDMYAMEHLFYHSRPFGTIRSLPYPAPLPPVIRGLFQNQTEALERLNTLRKLQEIGRDNRVSYKSDDDSTTHKPSA